MAGFEVWADNPIEADWFMGLDARLSSSTLFQIGKRGENSSVIDSLIIYDRPDIILLNDGRPLLVLEKTREVPTGHNVGQRFARLARSAEHGVPTLFFLPFDARKHGKYSSICSVNGRLLHALQRLGEVHKVPALAINWRSDGNGELIIDGSENSELKEVIGALISPPSLQSDATLREAKRKMEREYRSRVAAYPEYKNLPKSASFQNTRSFLSDRDLLEDSGAEHLMGRTNSLVYTMLMSPEKCKRQDPYTGMQFIYDYGWLREGPHPSARSSNLILNVPLVSLKWWQAQNPEDYSSKSCNWYLVADAIVLSDGVIPIKEWPLQLEY